MTGGGTICLTFTVAAVGVPTMSKQTFITTERVWYSVWNGMVGRDGEAVDIVIVHEESKS